MCKWFKKWCLPIIGFSVVTAVWWYFGGYEKALANGTDKFDSLNSLFAGLAFVGMLCTLYMQRQELSLQRKELKKASEAAQAQAASTAKWNQLNTLLQFKNFTREWIDGLKKDIQRLRNNIAEANDYDGSNRETIKILTKQLDEYEDLNRGLSRNIHEIWMDEFKKSQQPELTP